MSKLFFGVSLTHFIYILYFSAMDTEMYTYDNKNCFQSWLFGSISKYFYYEIFCIIPWCTWHIATPSNII